MTITEKHRTEYKLIDQAMNELTQMIQRIGTLEAAAEQYRIDAEQMRKNEMMNRMAIERLEEQLDLEKAKSEALSTDLVRVSSERSHIQDELNDVKVSMREQIAVLEGEREKLKSDLMRETDERENAVELLRKSFTQIQDLMNSVQSVMKP